MIDADLEGCDFEGAMLVQSNFKGANLTRANLADTDAKNAIFPFAKLSGAVLEGANLYQAIFVDVVAPELDARGAKLEMSIWHRAQCAGARFERCDLTYADFSHADLTGADFSGATMFRTRLHATTQKDATFPLGKLSALGDDALLAEAETWWERHRRPISPSPEPPSQG
jgi:uncharacterized protein YjbI with pentapeptide repeats